ncbi:MAG TPA: DUF2971 domain-containing protein [Alphaproteobacteria bacterium]|nr:DUF2971 domain-containing protein [Alphaproteobacteria bacterium]
MDTKAPLLGALFERLNDILAAEDQVIEDDRVLYHYTTLSSFLGIVEAPCFWASDLSFMNDRTELDYGLQLCFEELDDYVGGEQEREITAAVRRTIGHGPTRICVVSFCEDGDSLSQWRGYAEYGRGVAIGLRARNLVQQSDWDIQKVIYDEDRQRRLVRRFLEACLRLRREVANDAKSREEFRDAVAILLEYVASLLKHPAFRDERECRLIRYVSPEDNLQFRAAEKRIVPYTVVNCDRAAFHSVIIGPGLDYDNVETAVEILKRKYGMPQIETVRSGVPLRP